MATYFKYKDRDLDKRVDWSKVASGFTDRLAAEGKRRTELKDTLDEEFRTATQNEIDKRVLGQSENLNNWSVDFGDQLQKVALDAHRRLKNGTLDPREFSQIMQRLTDNTNNTYLALKEFQDSYKEHQELYEKGELGALDQYNMELMESMSIFNNSKAIVEADGNASIGIYDVDDEGNLAIGLGPKQTVAITAFRQGVNNKYKVLNTDAAVKKFIDGVGETEFITKQMNGRITEYYMQSDKTARDEMVKNGTMTQADLDAVDTFDKLSDAWVDTVFANPENIVSVLGDTLTSQGYGFTLDAAQQDDNTILLELKNGRLIPKFDGAAGEAQKEAARNALKVKALGAVDKKVKVTTVEPTRDRQRNYYDDKRDDEIAALESDIDMLANLYAFDEEKKGALQSSVTYFMTQEGNVKVKRTDDGVEITKADGTVIPLEFGGMSQAEFIRSALNALGSTSIGQANSIISKGNYNALKGVGEYESEIDVSNRAAAVDSPEMKAELKRIDDQYKEAFELVKAYVPKDGVNYLTEDTVRKMVANLFPSAMVIKDGKNLNIEIAGYPNKIVFRPAGGVDTSNSNLLADLGLALDAFKKSEIAALRGKGRASAY
jgi:hypothetical protein